MRTDVSWADVVLVVLPLSLLIALLLTFPVGALIQARYRRAVERRMRAAGPDPAPAADGDGAADSAPPLPPRIEAIDPDTPDPVLEREARAARRRWAAAYVAAGLCHALAMATFVKIANGFGPIGWGMMLYAGLWPVLLITARMVRARPWAFALAALAYLLAGQCFGPTATAAYINLAATAALPTIVLLAVSIPGLGSIGPLVFSALTLLPLAFVVSLWALGRAVGAAGLGRMPWAVGVLLALAAAGGMAWAVLGAVARGYRNGRISDRMLLGDAQWLAFTLVQAPCAVFLLNAEGRPPAFLAGLWLAGLLPFAVYRLALALALRLAMRGPRPEGIPLLLLRTFGARKRSERLVRELGERWRFIGPVQMIAGTDLATATLDPHELLDFVSGQLDRQFARTEADVRANVARMRMGRDGDGRFRVNELFCGDDTWRVALRAVAADPRPILMDVRGFAAENRGVAYELGYIIDHLDLRRVVMVTDDTTDRAALDATVRRLWARMHSASPNRRPESAVLRVVTLGRATPRALRGVHGALLHAAREAAAENRSPAVARG